ncbi:MAG: archease [Planctomycetales bacterium]|nr:archease [Planctomycetales bacterium]
MFEIFDHTADLGIRVAASDVDALFAEAGRALFAVIVGEGANLDCRERVEIRIAGNDREYLLLDWLSELLYLFETRKLLLGQFDVHVDDRGLTAEVRGEPIDPARHNVEHEVKAITYHGLRIETIDGRWQAEVILDI